MDIPPEFFVFVAIGLAAQTVDGALGMAYGVTSSSLLLAFGLPPALASASVHAAEVATTGVSGLSHGLFGNIDRGLLWQLALPGVVGGALGAWFLGSVDLAWLRPLVAAYLLWRSLRQPEYRQHWRERFRGRGAAFAGDRQTGLQKGLHSAAMFRIQSHEIDNVEAGWFSPRGLVELEQREPLNLSIGWIADQDRCNAGIRMRQAPVKGLRGALGEQSRPLPQGTVEVREPCVAKWHNDL